MDFIKQTLIFFSIAIFFSGCKFPNDKSKIEGSFQFPVETKLSLYELKQNKAHFIDSVLINNSSLFEFTFDSKYPAFYMLKFFNNEKIYLICHPGEHIEVKIDNNRDLNYYVEGSSDSKLLRNLIFEQEKAKKSITRLSMKYDKEYQNGFKKHPRSYYDSIYNGILEKHKTFSEEFILSNPNSLASIFALYQDFGTQKPIYIFDKQDDFHTFAIIDSVLTQKYPNTDAVLALNKDVVEARQRKKYNLSWGKQLKPGIEFPLLELKTIDNRSITAKSLQGKTVVYFVFATWDKINASSVSKINLLYQKYKKNNIEIIGISLDKSMENLQEYLKINKIKFPVVCDLQYWESPLVDKLQVQQLPTVVIVDKNGLVVSNKQKITDIETTLLSNPN